MTDVLGERVVLDDVGPARRGRAYPTFRPMSLMPLPAVVLIGGLLIWPVLRIAQASLTGSDGDFAGLRNFQLAVDEYGFWPVLGRTVLWAVVMPIIIIVLGYLLATMSRRTRSGRAARLLLVAPAAVPLVVTGVVFRLLDDPDPDRGVASWVLARLPGDWSPLLSPTLVTVSLMVAFAWAWVGLAMVVFRAALESLPAELADLVRVQGGNRWQVFRDAQFRPLLRRTITVVFVLVALGTARSFDLILIMVPGSVRDDASVMAVRIWQAGGTATTGPAAALGVIWLVLVLAVMLAGGRFMRQPWPPPPLRESAHGQPIVLRLWRAIRRRPEPDTPPIAVTDLPDRRWRVAPRLVIWLAMLVWLVPLIVLLLTSLRPPRQAATRPWWKLAASWDSYAQILRSGKLANAMQFTLVMAVGVTVLVLVLGMLAAYPLAWSSGWPARTAGVLLVCAMVVPVQVIAGPVTDVLGLAGVAGSTAGLALTHVARGLPFAILVLRNALADLPPTTVLAAQLAYPRREGLVLLRLSGVVWRAVIAVCVLEFVQVWNDLVVGLLFSGPRATPLGVVFYGQARQFVTNSGPMAAGSVLVSLLPVLLFILARRQVVAGLISGGAR